MRAIGDAGKQLYLSSARDTRWCALALSSGYPHGGGVGVRLKLHETDLPFHFHILYLGSGKRRYVCRQISMHSLVLT